MSDSMHDLDTDPLISVSGALVLLLSGGVVLILGCLCVSVCICCRCLKPVPQIKDESLNYGGGTSPPEPHQFCPPSPPKLPLPQTTSAFTPRKQVGVTIAHDGYTPGRFTDEFGSPINADHHDYAYVRNDVHRNLL
ncbi:hypothetical protein OSTOST_10488 [Ostertagia ostertagi]